jgi:hypothetical protein
MKALSSVKESGGLLMKKYTLFLSVSGRERELEKQIRPQPIEFFPYASPSKPQEVPL